MIRTVKRTSTDYTINVIKSDLMLLIEDLLKSYALNKKLTITVK